MNLRFGLDSADLLRSSRKQLGVKAQPNLIHKSNPWRWDKRNLTSKFAELTRARQVLAGLSLRRVLT